MNYYRIHESTWTDPARPHKCRVKTYWTKSEKFKYDVLKLYYPEAEIHHLQQLTINSDRFLVIQNDQRMTVYITTLEAEEAYTVESWTAATNPPDAGN